MRVPKTFRFIFLILVFVINTLPVFAQSGLRLVLAQPELDQFPGVSLYLDVYDAQNAFVSGLEMANFKVFEDGVERPLNEGVAIQPGLHSVIALNLGPTLSNKGAYGANRFEETRYYLQQWLDSAPLGASDTFSLITNEGAAIERLVDKAAFNTALGVFRPNLYNYEPTLAALSAALVVTGKPNLTAHSKQAILFITALPIERELTALPALAQQAARQNVPLYIWLLAPATAANSSAAQALAQAAQTSGGIFYHFTETLTPPNPETYFRPLRSTYRLRYTSTSAQSGSHTVRVEVTRGDQRAVTPELNFNVSLNLPLPSLIDLPATIQRRLSLEANGTRKLMPEVFTLRVRVDFPDGFPRQLKAARLYVDGELAVENTSPPLEFLGWNLSSYRSDGSHSVSVEVEDVLGFRSLSAPQVVNIVVEQAYPTWFANTLLFLQRGGWIALAGALALISLLTWLRLRPVLAQRAQLRAEAADASLADPLTQALPGLEAYEAQIPILDYPTPPSAARLVWQAGGPALPDFELSGSQSVIGSDAGEARFVVAHPSVSAAHARVTIQPDGTARVADLGSKAGTWLNYAPVAKHGALLQDGDLLAIGKVTFCYELGMKKHHHKRPPAAQPNTFPKS